MYYSGGAEVGCLSPCGHQGNFLMGRYINFGGVNRADVSYIKILLNHDSSNYSALGEIVHDGDEMHFLQKIKVNPAIETGYRYWW